MRNDGYGTAKAVKVETMKPTIVENRSGLLISFNLLAAQIGGLPVSPKLDLELGDIAPGTTKEALWWMSSSLMADFIEYEATFSHLDDLGERNLSLIDLVRVHPTLHVVRADVPTDDLAPDFLVNDGFLTNSLPESLYFSDGALAPVMAVTNGLTHGVPGSGVTNAQLTVDLPAGWIYVRVPDPAPSTVVLSSVQRSDGRWLMVGPNVWSTHRNVYPVVGDSYREDFMHLLDYVTTAGTYTYTLGYNVAPEAPLIMSQPVGVTNEVGTSATFAVTASGTAPLTYQWFRNDSLLPGQVGQEIEIPNVTRDHEGEYHVRVSNAAGVTNSANVWLEVFDRPIIDQVTNQFAIVGRQLSITNHTGDLDIPIIWSADRTSWPAGASIDPTNGVFRWTPACWQGSSTFPVTVWATDSDRLRTSKSTTFTVTVLECVEASLGKAVVQAGHSTNVPIYLLSNLELTNMAFSVIYPPAWFTTNFTLTINAPEVLSTNLVVVPTGRVDLSFTLSSNSILYGPKEVGQLGFTADSSQSSTFLWLPVMNVQGLKPNGEAVANWYGLPGRVVVVGEELLLEAWLATNRQPMLTLYALPGPGYSLEWKTNLVDAWTTHSRFEMTNLWQEFEVPRDVPSLFYRAVRGP